MPRSTTNPKFSRPGEGEAPFLIEEIFFSRTDRRGVIQAGNEVFRRVSDYDWSALIGAPHKVIRHPDTPKGVFWLFWDRLGRGLPMSGYIKNRARDGLHYWVYAIVMPLDDGYLSIRIKPTSPMLQSLREVYAVLAEAERSGELSPEASAVRLQVGLQELGFADYMTFMLASLKAEVEARDTILRIAQPTQRSALGKLGELVDTLQKETAGLIRQFEDIRSVPTNLRIAAAALGDAGRPLSAISENYALMCREIWTQLGTVTSGTANGFGSIISSIAEARYLDLLVGLQFETVRQFQSENSADSPIDRAFEVCALETLSDRYTGQSRTSLAEVMGKTKTMARTYAELRRLVAGLDMTRVLCRVESGRLTQVRAASLGGIIDNLEHFHAAVAMRLESITRLNHDISRCCSGLDSGGSSYRAQPRRLAAAAAN